MCQDIGVGFEIAVADFGETMDGFRVEEFAVIGEEWVSDEAGEVMRA